MLATPAKIRQYLSDSATCCIFEPGSVTAMNRLPANSSPTAALMRSKKYCLKMFGSSVPPDLLETMHRVLLRSSLSWSPFICTGSVESRTCNSGKAATFPKGMRKTSGHRLEPPIPSSKTCLNLAFLTSPANCFKAARLAICSSAMVSQPSQLLSSLLVQSEASFCQRRATLLLLFQSASDASTAASKSLGSFEDRRFTVTHAPLHAYRLLRSAARRPRRRASR